jgi:nucleotide-binding universal stress UspA family protein
MAPSASPPPIDLVVAYDASEPADRALDWSIRILAYRRGTLHVVYVSRPAGAAGLSGIGYAEMLEANDEVANDILKLVEQRLAPEGLMWSFERRDGSPVEEILAAAKERSATAPSDTTTTFIVVGRSAHAIHHLIGSVPVGLLHRSEYPVVVVP